MPSKLSIFNRALAQVSADPVADISEESRERRVCDQFFEECRDELLEAYYWPFATKLVKLEKLATPNIGWDYAYAYPGDCVDIQFMFPKEIIDCNYADFRSISIPFRILGDEDNPVIVSNFDNVYLLYTFRQKNIALYPVSFVKALGTLLASEIAIPIIKGREGIQMNQYLAQKYEADKDRAITQQANQVNIEEHISDLVRSYAHPRPPKDDETIGIY